MHEKFDDELVLSRESSSFVYESVEECNIHFHKIDLRRGSSFIDTPEWLKNKKATINPQNANNPYCFMYAIAIALFHEGLGNNPGRVSKILIEYVNAFNWHEIDFPASYDDYALLEKLKDAVALNILYVHLNEANICPEYISKCNFGKKHQVVLVKIDDEEGKWHFLAVPSNLDVDGFRRPKKVISRLFEGISSKSHGDFYCYGCFYSFRTEIALKNHGDLCKNNKFTKIELPNEAKKFKEYKLGVKALKMNTVIYADFESILLPYSACEKQNETNKSINKHVACGYSINVVDNHKKHVNKLIIVVTMLFLHFVKKSVLLHTKKLVFARGK